MLSNFKYNGHRFLMCFGNVLTIMILEVALIMSIVYQNTQTYGRYNCDESKPNGLM